jgi:hypothetical protein
MQRTIPYYVDKIVPDSIAQGKNVLIASSENAIRGLLMHLCEVSMMQSIIIYCLPFFLSLSTSLYLCLSPSLSHTHAHRPTSTPPPLYLYTHNNTS